MSAPRKAPSSASTSAAGKKKKGANRRVIADTIEISSEEDVAESVSLMNLGTLQKMLRQLKEVSCVIAHQ